MRVDRVFVDTNIILSGLIYKGKAGDVLDSAIKGDICLVLADAVAIEVRRVLKNKFPEQSGEFEDYLESANCEPVPYPSDADIEHALMLLRDPNDAPVLASILNCKPDVALTGDKDLLTDEVKAIAPVCTCAEYLQRLEVI